MLAVRPEQAGDGRRLPGRCLRSDPNAYSGSIPGGWPVDDHNLERVCDLEVAAHLKARRDADRRLLAVFGRQHNAQPSCLAARATLGIGTGQPEELDVVRAATEVESELRVCLYRSCPGQAGADSQQRAYLS